MHILEAYTTCKIMIFVKLLNLDIFRNYLKSLEINWNYLKSLHTSQSTISISTHFNHNSSQIASIPISIHLISTHTNQHSSQSAPITISSESRHLSRLLSKGHYQNCSLKKALSRYLVLFYSSSESSEEISRWSIIYPIIFFFLFRCICILLRHKSSSSVKNKPI